MDNAVRSGVSPGRKFIRYWLPVILMLGTTAYLSTDMFSNANTRSVVDILVQWFRPHTKRHVVNQINFAVRKSAHFGEYALLAMLVFRAFRADSLLRWKLSWFCYTVLMVAGWSLLDELHQFFTRTRGASIYDSMLDTAGGLFGLAIVALINLRPRQLEP
ncbi:MAG TPA: VanZ family protein [Blastocatellia bacterium]|nr:VanZ family protein [Blastocatellia bacterium]